MALIRTPPCSNLFRCCNLFPKKKCDRKLLFGRALKSAAVARFSVNSVAPAPLEQSAQQNGVPSLPNEQWWRNRRVTAASAFEERFAKTWSHAWYLKMGRNVPANDTARTWQKVQCVHAMGYSLLFFFSFTSNNRIHWVCPWNQVTNSPR